VEKGKEKTLIDRVWDFLASIKLAVVVFAVLALTSIIGTIIEQNAEPEKNIKLLTKLFGASAAPTLFKMYGPRRGVAIYCQAWSERDVPAALEEIQGERWRGLSHERRGDRPGVGAEAVGQEDQERDGGERDQDLLHRVSGGSCRGEWRARPRA